jgi:DNA-3-methyladenine glycosylase I
LPGLIGLLSGEKDIMDTFQRCEWTGGDPLMIAYHDEEWGVPDYDDQRLFEKLLLDGAQAGLSWITILRKRDHYREAFDNFNPQKIARYDDNRVQELLNNPGIIRNRLKVNAFITNAQVYLDLKTELGSFSDYLWDFVDGIPLINHFQSVSELPAQTPESAAMSKALKERGFKFVGPTICYAFMQAVGMVNDHVTSCFRFYETTGR